MQSLKRDQQAELKHMHITKWRESGVKMSQYCKEAKIPISTFSAWVKHDSRAKVNVSPDFKRVVMQGAVTLPKTEPAAAIEFTVNDTIKIKLHTIPNHDVLIAITKALMSCN